MTTVLITLPQMEPYLEPVRAVAPEAEIVVQAARQVADVPADLWARAEVLYTSNVLPTREIAPRLRWIQCHWAGIDALLDAPILYDPEVTVTTLSGAALLQMGEYILMMLLALGHRLPDLVAHQRRAEWPKNRWARFAPQELNASTVGIVGYGSLGREVARLLQPFGATVLATKRDVKHPEDRGYTPPGYGDPGGDRVHRLYPPQALRSMLRACDFVVVTVPLTPETRGLIGAAEFAVMKPTACLVDVSRGGVVDHAALIAALREGRLAAAALDVFPQEPLPADSPLWTLENVLLTPHIAGVTRHYDERAMRLFAANLERYLRNLPLYNRFDPQRGY